MPPIDFNGLDTAVHGPIRLGVLTALEMDGPLKWLDRLLLRAEEKGWIFYRKKSGSGIVSGGVGELVLMFL